MKLFTRLVFVALATLLGGCASFGVQPRSIIPAEVVAMAKSGQSSDAIIQKLKDSRTVYQLSAAELVKLHEEGVPTPVLDYMQATYLDAIRADESQRAFFYHQPPYWYGRSYYYPWWW